MPGGRLGLQERRRIAAGLADGRSYSEIARELDRPVSTITREIGRNGGPGDYRADRAQHAAQRRARRSAPTPVSPSPAPSATDTHGRDAQAVQDFEERLSALLITTGLSRMTARVLASIYTTDAGSLTAAELARHLRVSPASVSKAVGYLEEQELIRREREARGRAERYVIDDDIWYQAMLASARVNAQLAQAAREGARTLDPSTPAGARLGVMGQFLDRVNADLTQAAEHWRRVFTVRPTPDRPGAQGDRTSR